MEAQTDGGAIRVSSFCNSEECSSDKSKSTQKLQVLGIATFIWASERERGSNNNDLKKENKSLKKNKQTKKLKIITNIYCNYKWMDQSINQSADSLTR